MDPESVMEDLIERILEVTKSPGSTAFYRKAIGLLGHGLVESELAEVRYRFRAGQAEDPARYLTTLLKKHLDELPSQESKPGASRNDPESKSSYFSPSQMSLFSELKPAQTAAAEHGTDKEMYIPYSKNGIPWATFVGPEFFTLSTNKAKSDRVMAKFRTLDGRAAMVPVIRGRFFPDDDERGILTAEHGRVLGALESIWIKEGCKYTEFGNGSAICYCDVSVRKLAQLLGWEEFGGWQLKHLKKRVTDLKVRPYYLDLEAVGEFKSAGLKGYGFTLIGDITLVDRKESGLLETTLKIRFSDTFSKQLLARRTVSRPRELITHRCELAFLLRLYLEPILISRNGETYEVGLARLIESLNLPPAKWHRFKSQRRNQFKKAVCELNGKKTIDGKTISASIEQGKNYNDFLLVAQLRGEIQPN